MSVRQTRSLSRDIRYILHPLNVSKSKSTFSFQKTQRFLDPKSHSPNKFYNIASEKSKIGFSMPKGNRPLTQNIESIPPNRYNIKSQFQLKRHMRTSSDTFGISRQGFYKGQQSKIMVGPGDYNFPKEMGNKSFYIGQKIKPFEKGHKQGFLNTANSVNKLSTYINESAAVRLKTEYYPKNKFYKYDNKVPGPGAYDQGQTKNSTYRNTLTTFGATQRLRTQKPNVVGPGSYPQFSQFGNPQ